MQFGVVHKGSMDELLETLTKFVIDECIPAEKEFEAFLATHGRWGKVPRVLDSLKLRARELGLWNLFLPKDAPRLPPGCGENPGLSVEEYAKCAEIMGMSGIAPEACNCSAPDTGNMEILLSHGSDSQKTKYLAPLLRGEIRSAFLMTEPMVASSDARNVSTSIRLDERGRDWILRGRKWWATGAMDPRCAVAFVLCRHDGAQDAPSESRLAMLPAKWREHSVAVVPLPRAGYRVIRPLTVLGTDDAPIGHAEVVLDGVKTEGFLGPRGGGFLVAQARLGPGRLHHCMRAVGMGERALALHLARAKAREAFGKKLIDLPGEGLAVAHSRKDIELARAIVQSAARAMDTHGAHGSDIVRTLVSVTKVAVPHLIGKVVDRAMQAHGASGLHGSPSNPLPKMLAGMRALRIADGPDAVHVRVIERLERRRSSGTTSPKL